MCEKNYLKCLGMIFYKKFKNKPHIAKLITQFSKSFKFDPNQDIFYHQTCIESCV